MSTGVEKATGKALEVSLVAASFKSITFTLDPISSSLEKDAASAKALGFITSTDLTQPLRPHPAEQAAAAAGQAGDPAP